MDGLGVSEVNAEKDACLIEHIISQESLEKMQTFVSKQEQNPYSKDCSQEDMPCENAESAIPLSRLSSGQKAMVLCIYGGECLKKRLQEYGFLVNETIEMIRNVSNSPFLILVKGYQVALGRGVGEKILIKPLETT